VLAHLVFFSSSQQHMPCHHFEGIFDSLVLAIHCSFHALLLTEHIFSQAGADVYSITGRSAQDALSRDIASQKAEVLPFPC
jgi:hypothetical protein